MNLRVLPAGLILVLLAACGGPDTKPMLEGCAQQAAAAERALGAGDWATATASIQAARQALGADLALVADDGRPLDAHWAGRAKSFSTAVAAVLPRLGEAKDRAELGRADALVAACSDQGLAAAWRDGARAAADARITEAETAAKAEAERKHALELASAYVLVLTKAKPGSDAEAFCDKVTAIVRERFAPVAVLVQAKAPAPGQRCGGIITLSSTCERVDYGGPTDIHGQGIPVAMETSVTVRSLTRPCPLDGTHTFQVRKPTPEKVSLYQLAGLRRDQERALNELMAAKLAGLPQLDGAAAIAERLAADAAAPLPPAWRLQASYKTTGGKAPSPVLASSSYRDVLAELTAELQRRLGGAPLLEAADQPAPAGTVTLLLLVDEATYGSQAGMIKTVNGILPTAMSAQVTIAPAAGTPRRGIYRAAGSPETVAKGDLDDAVRSQRKKLGGQLAAQIAADKALGE